MSALYEYTGLACVFAWLLTQALRLYFPQRTAVLVGLLAAVILVLGLRTSLIVSLPIAVLSPIGAVLPALILRDMASRAGIKQPEIGSLDLSLFFVGYLAFLLAATGFLSFDPYRYGYYPIAGTLVAAALCLLALFRGHWPLCLGILIGQAAWTFDLGSSNLFDHLSHGSLFLVVPVVLAKRVLLR